MFAVAESEPVVEERARVHIRDRSGTAVCGEPAKQDQLVDWGGDHTCRRCALLYGQDVWGR